MLLSAPPSSQGRRKRTRSKSRAFTLLVEEHLYFFRGLAVLATLGQLRVGEAI